MKFIRIAVLLFVALLTFAGCASGSDESTSGVDGAYDTSFDVQQDDTASDAEQESVPAPEFGAEAADEREVVTNGSLTLVADDASAASDQIVALVERAGGRVDGRSERAATQDEDASAWLTVRVPSGELTATITKVENLGEVPDVSITSDDVTRRGQDLDARIMALEPSTDRLLDLMTDADSSEALIAAEDALSERQADLESLRPERTLATAPRRRFSNEATYAVTRMLPMSQRGSLTKLSKPTLINLTLLCTPLKPPQIPWVRVVWQLVVIFPISSPGNVAAGGVK